MAADAGREVRVKELILVPALITLGVTLLRLVGELMNWSPLLFGKAAGGGGSLVGISWLPLVFGVYFAAKLVRGGHAPAGAGRAVGLALLALVAMFGSAALGGVLQLPQLAMMLLFVVVSAVGIVICLRGWPELSRVLTAYGFAARIPVMVVMLIAILGNWGTHYDVPPPNWPEVDQWNPILKWLAIGVLPQATVWIAFTVVVGSIVGGITAAILKRSQPATA